MVYYVSKFIIRYNRREENAPATNREKIISYVVASFIVAGISIGLIILNSSEDYTSRDTYLGISIFMVLLISSFWGIRNAYIEDKTLTLQEREEYRRPTRNNIPT
jgi:hypothetical protein